MDMVERPHGDGANGAVSILELLEHLRGRLAEGGFSQARSPCLDGYLFPSMASMDHLNGSGEEPVPFAFARSIEVILGVGVCRCFALLRTQIIGQSAGNDNLGGNSNSTRTLPCTSNSGGGLMGGLGGGFGNAMAGSAYPSPGMVGGDGGLLGALAGLGGAWMGGGHHPDAVATAGPQAGDMPGDESGDEDAVLDDDFEEDYFEDEYSDYDEDD
eukprot:Skav207394  [mRNA]  locus=scaffold2421:93771:95873:+ [translate_table: standard]